LTPSLFPLPILEGEIKVREALASLKLTESRVV